MTDFLGEQPLSFDDLTNPEDWEDVRNRLLVELNTRGFPVNDWEEGGVAMVLLETFSKGFASVLRLVSAVAKAGHLGTATGSWLTVLALYNYSVTRNPAIAAEVRVRVTNGTGGALTFPTAAWLRVVPDDGRRWQSTNATPLTVTASGGHADVTFRAHSAGAGGNLGLSNTVALVTPVSGLTVALQDTGNGTPREVAGTDEESDEALRTRCRLQWAKLATGIPAATLEVWALEANPQVTRVFVDASNPDGPGSVRTYIATQDGPVPTSPVDVRAVVEAYQRARLLETLAEHTYVSAATVDTFPVAATVYVKAAQHAAVASAGAAAIRALMRSTPIGDGSGAVALDRSQVIETLMALDGVVRVPVGSVLINGSGSDYSPTKGHVLNAEASVVLTLVDV